MRLVVQHRSGHWGTICGPLAARRCTHTAVSRHGVSARGPNHFPKHNWFRRPGVLTRRASWAVFSARLTGISRRKAKSEKDKKNANLAYKKKHEALSFLLFFTPLWLGLGPSPDGLSTVARERLPWYTGGPGPWTACCVLFLLKEGPPRIQHQCSWSWARPRAALRIAH
jgi:hypothetical protein